MRVEATTTGTVEDVAAFFRVSVRTVQNWIANPKPRLTFWREGRNLCFGEAAVVELRVKFLIASRAYAAGEPEEIARREWRDLLAVRQSAIRNPQSEIPQEVAA